MYFGYEAGMPELEMTFVGFGIMRQKNKEEKGSSNITGRGNME